MSYRVIVTGPRDYTDRIAVRTALDVIAIKHSYDGLIVSHGASGWPKQLQGADRFASEWCWDMRDRGVLEQQFRVTPEQWSQQGPAAGPMRNQRIVDAGADECLWFVGPCTRPWCRRRTAHPSHGAAHCAARAKAAGIPVRRFEAPDPGRAA